MKHEILVEEFVRYRYAARCLCGWVGWSRKSKHRAEEDAERHLEEHGE